MKVLVAGGAGFIGSHLIDALLKEGHEIICIDNFFNGIRDNIAHLENNAQFTLYEQDLCDLEKLEQVFEKEKIEFVFHLAANSDIQASAKKPQVEYLNTYSTTFNILECMRKFQVKKLFFSSTSAVYGEKYGEQVSETTPLQPISYYGAAKLGSEGMISAYSYMNQMSVLMFRFPNVIGPRLTHGVVYDFVHKLKANPKELTILGDGKQCKPFIFVLDLVDAIMRFKDELCEGITLYNIGTGTQSTVTGIAQIVCEKMGLSDVTFQYTGGRSGWRGDVPIFSYNLDKINKTGWRAQWSSDQAVALTVEAII